VSTWRELWVQTVILWTLGILGFSIGLHIWPEMVERKDLMPIALFFLSFSFVFVGAVTGDLHTRLEDLRRRAEQLQDDLDALARHVCGEFDELDESELEG
jgi:hypothetical protein